MTPADDLRVGQHVAVIRVKSTADGFMNGVYGNPQPPSYDGYPLKILAISLPFVSVSNGREVFGLDVRDIDVKVVNAKYVKAMTSTEVLRKIRRRKRKKEKPDPKLCPNCKEGCLVERLIVQAGKPNIWIAVCTVCGYGSEPVET